MQYIKFLGYIASNHINAKVSSISFRGVFYLMSIRIGDGWIKVSNTVSLNRIRKSEELEKGWRKDEVAMPVEFRDFDLVHVVPLKTVLKSRRVTRTSNRSPKPKKD